MPSFGIHIKNHVPFGMSSKKLNPKNKIKNKNKIFTWLFFNSPTFVPFYLPT
jgi:hypothetical protein